MLLSLAQAVDANSLVHTMRDIAWIGAMINVMHLLALAIFAGAVVVVDLRFMGTGLTREPLSEIASQARPWLMAGFWGLVVTGLFQLALQPVKEYYSDMFNFKMKVMFVAIIFTFFVRPRLAQMDEARLGRIWGKLVGLASLTLWAGVAIPARLIGLVG
jgi:Family of unknown function (DUF6644)